MNKPKYKSQFERNVAASFKKQGIKYGYETRKFPFVQPSKKRNYTPDFELQETGLFVECKGKLTKEERDKLIWIKETYPDLPFVLLFMRARNPIRKGSKTSYSQWATANGFENYDWEAGGIPTERLKRK
jgi:hypothetical protein